MASTVAGVVVCLALASGSAAAGCGGVYWRSLRVGNQRCPQAHSLLSDTKFLQLHWTRWDAQGAIGSGVVVHTSSGVVDQRDPISIRLSGTIRCAVDGRRIYTRINVTQYSATGAHQYGWRYRCRPTLPSRGAGGGGG